MLFRSFATKSIVVLLADLDHFKSINDRLGHATGDRVLRIFSKEVRQRLGSGALFGRLGGEEFAILLRNAGNAKGLAAAERIRLCFEAAAATMDGRPLGATVSIGMVTSESGPHNINALLAQADEALYCAKERGRNRVETTSYQPPPDVPKYPDRKQTVRRKRKMARPDAA